MAEYINISGQADSISNAIGQTDFIKNIRISGQTNSISNSIGHITARKMVRVSGVCPSISSSPFATSSIIIVPRQNIVGNIMYRKAQEALLKGEIKSNEALFKVMLLNQNYIPSTQHTYDDIMLFAAEVNGSGYTAGGKIVSGSAADGGKLIANNIAWTNISLTSAVRWALLYIDNSLITPFVPNLAIAVYDFGTGRIVNGAYFSLLWGITGGQYGSMLEMAQKDIPVSQKIITA